jgi:TonB family protein
MNKQILTLSLVFLSALGAPTAVHAADPAATPAPLSHEEIKSTVDGHLGDVKACMRDHGAATGKLVVQFSIAPDGKVNDPKPKERSSNDALDKCIASAFGRWTFPKPRGGVIMGVVYPFTFAAPKAIPKGTLDQAVIVKTVKDHQPDLAACYNAAVKAKPGIAGTVKVAFVIAPSGQVSEAKVDKSDTEWKPLDECVVTKLRSWTFPKPAGNGEVAIIYPFIFDNTAAAAGKAAGKERDQQPAQH